MTKKIKKVRGRGRFYLLWLCILGVVFFAGHQARALFSDVDFFTLKSITIRGNRLVSIEHLYSIAEPFKGTNIFEIDLQDLEKRYQAVSRVSSIKFRRVYPSRLIITVRERQGMFYVRDNQGGFHPIDRDRVVLDKADWYLEEDIPLINIIFPREQIVLGERIENPRIEHIFEVFEAIVQDNPSIANDISEFYFRNDNLYFIDMRSGSRVILGRDNVSQQIHRFMFLRDNQGFDRNSTIDLRFEGQIIIT